MLHLAPSIKHKLFETFGPLVYPRMDDGHILYVVGDIHGRADCLREAHRQIDLDRLSYRSDRPSTEIYLGDYIDRGPDAKGVIDLLIARRRQVEAVFLRGNHEVMMQSFLDGDLPFSSWRTFGGGATLRSYGVGWDHLRSQHVTPDTAMANIAPGHRAFLRDLANYHIHGDYCFVHAGLRPGRAVPDQSPDDLAWIRGEFLSHTGRFGFVVVHGHTPVDAVDFRRNRINIDTGAYRTSRLSVLRIAEAGPRRLNAA